MNIYAANILDHYKEPRNRGVLKAPDFSARKKNLLCGDEIKVSLKMSGANIKVLKFEGQGCAISQAAISLLTEFLPGKSKATVLKMNLKDLENILGIKVSEQRRDCALLGLRAIQAALMEK